jgi:hypothetical protein
MPDVPINAQAVIAAGQGYTVPDSIEIVLKSVRAQYDGSGAGGSFVPLLQIVAPGNLVVWEGPASATVAAGASADVSWFQGVAAQASSAGGNGVLYDTSPQGAGHYLYSDTDTAGPSGYGLRLQDATPTGLLIEAHGASGDATLESDMGTVHVWADAADVDVQAGTSIGLAAQTGISLQANTEVDIGADESVVIQANLAGGGGNRIQLDPGGGPTLRLNDDGTGSLGPSSLLTFRIDDAGNLRVILGAAATLTVYDSGINPIFRVNEDGSLQGKTGQALTFNL